MSARDSWEPITAAVLCLLSELDPYRLEPGAKDGAPVDEYSPEALPMASHLINRGEISAADINEIWKTWFGEPLGPIDDERFCRFVADLNALIAPLP